jgi:hypothetical protein
MDYPWRTMPKSNGHEPTQETQPQPKPDGTIAESVEIPIPSREEVLRDLGKVAKPKPGRENPPE